MAISFNKREKININEHRHTLFGAFLVTQMVKIYLQCGRPGFDPWLGKIPWGRERLSTPVFWPTIQSMGSQRVRHD